MNDTSAQAILCRVPHPYKAMLAICSDLDETPDRRTYWEIMRFLNTREPTSMGKGAGLEVGNSIYFRDRPGQFTYWDTDDAGREMVRTLIRSGHIDCLHSFGREVLTRKDAQAALEELEKFDCRLSVWVDHSTSVTNFGLDVTRGFGDVPGHEAYHADLAAAHGIRFVWRGRVTSVTGQDVPASLGGIFSIRHPAESATTLGKEAAKHILAVCGNKKFAMHATNRVLRPSTLRDGRRVYEFMRFHPYYAGMDHGATGREVGGVLTERMLATLLRREGIGILYTHLGKIDNPQSPLGPAAQTAFRRLARLLDSGELLVTTTHRLLKYLAVRDNLRYSVSEEPDAIMIRVEAINDPVLGEYIPSLDDLQGISFKTGSEKVNSAILSIVGRDGDVVLANDSEGHFFVPWRPLIFPSGTYSR
jgi:hypothetical protein